MKKLVDFKNMNQKQKLVFIIFVVLILIILTWILRILRNKSELERHAIVDDYSKVSSATYFSLQGDLTFDRQVYWDLNDIITEFINSAKYTYSEDFYTVANYYDALTDEYQFYLGENRYNEVAKNFINKFKITSAQEVNYKTYNIIEEIYELSNNMYICNLVGFDNQKASIGIALNKNSKTFEIFYIE